MARSPRLGRPSKLSDEVINRLLSALRQGTSFSSASYYAGIDPETLRAWLRRGESEPSGEYRDFSVQVNQAIAVSENTLVRQLRTHSQANWRATAFMLERRFPDTWGRKVSADAVENKLIELFVYLSRQNPAVYKDAMQILGEKLPIKVKEILPSPAIFEEILSDEQLLELIKDDRW